MTEPVDPEPRRALLASCRALLGRSLDVARRFESGEVWPREARQATAHLQLALLVLEELDDPDSRSIDAWAMRLTSRLLEWETTPPAPPASPTELAAPARTEEEGEPDLEGDTRSIPMPELLGFLQMQEKSGRLKLVTATEEFLIVLDRGVLTHAASNATPKGLRLGEILVSRGAISRADLTAFLDRHKGSTTRLGEALQREELVDHRALRGALSYQVQELFHRLFRAQSARFAFWEGEPQDSPCDLGLNVIQLLLESARFHDEHKPT